MFQTIPLITGIFSLLAFVAAIGLLAYRSQLKQSSDLLKGANSPTKLKALNLVLRRYHINADSLTQDQQFQLAQKELDLHAKRQLQMALTVGAIALLLAVVAIVYIIGGGGVTFGDGSPVISGVDGDVTVSQSVSQ
ncbi:MAG: hypothetical protein EOP22_05550 [Hyphomicrobiales bacterium]|nr:MAG: hypothetical protein EOP22_05550 [Hyphomicrobiales bacterium]